MTTCALIILDGIGLRDATESNALAAAHTPTLDKLMAHCPNAQIATSGLAVGLPEGQMGNSEVGHMNLGAGRVVYQSLTRIDKAIADGSFAANEALSKLIGGARERGGAVHLMGLLSPGGVHSHINQILAACRILAKSAVKQFYVHAFLDGRDTPPRSATPWIEALQKELLESGHGRVATVTGRYFALDRDNRWLRVEPAYRAIVQGYGRHRADSAAEALRAAYARGENDEFVEATVIGKPAPLRPEDAVLFMNFRPDRARQICQALVAEDFSGFTRPFVLNPEQVLTLTRYADDLPCPCAFGPVPIENSLGEYLAKLGKRQLRIAETEKYAHVTFFFNGGRESPFEGEERILIPSPAVASYDMQPQMSAPELTGRLIEAIGSQRFDLIVCNYANGDMVGHTGSFSAAVQAVEALDSCLARVVDAILAVDGQCLITADHGNVEQMSDPMSGQAHTSHTLNPVPLILVKRHQAASRLANGRLCDIAPTLLQMMDIPSPPEMEGSSLLTA